MLQPPGKLTEHANYGCGDYSDQTAVNQQHSSARGGCKLCLLGVVVCAIIEPYAVNFKMGHFSEEFKQFE
jgi:hypothetical protein